VARLGGRITTGFLELLRGYPSGRLQLLGMRDATASMAALTRPPRGSVADRCSAGLIAQAAARHSVLAQCQNGVDPGRTARG
jgi:hypothetical protein